MELFVKDRSFYRTLGGIAVPITLQSFISFGLNYVGMILLGRYGEITMSAASLSATFYSLFSTICNGLGGGAAVLVAQFWGKKDTDSIKDTMSILLKICVGLSLMFTAVTLAVPDRILSLYTGDETVIKEGVPYLRIMAIGFLFNGLSLAATNVLRSIGKVKVPLYTSIAVFVINIFLSYTLIFGHFGAPELAIRGAAIATVTARVVECLAIFGYLVAVDRDVGFRLKDAARRNGEILKRYLKTGLPVLVSDALMVLGNNVLIMIIGHTGTEFTAANSIASVANNLIYMFAYGLCTSSGIMTGNTIGEGKKEKAYRQGVTFISLGVIIGIVGSVVLLLVSGPFLSLYDVGEETARYARQLLIILSSIYIFQLMEINFTKGILRGGGDTRFLIVGDSVFMWTVSIPLGCLAAFVWGSPIWLVFLLLKVDLILKTLLCFWRFLSKKWIHDVTVPEG